MKNILFLFLLILISSCSNPKLINSDSKNEVKLLDSLNINEVLIKDTLLQDSLLREFEQFKEVSEMKILPNDNNRRIEEQIKLIEKHEKKTKLKVIDRTSKKADTNKGWIAYSIPEEMQVAKSYSVKVRISKKDGQSKAKLILGDQDAINNPQYPSVATIEDVVVSGEMSAELRGDVSTFKIVALSTPLQNIDNESYTEWEWIVTPLKGGQSPLKLVVMLKDLNKDIVVFNRFIQVKTNVPVAVEGFFDKYWQWFMTTIIIPIFLYFWNRKKSKTKKS